MPPSWTGMHLVPCIPAASEALNAGFLAAGSSLLVRQQRRSSGLRPRCASDGSRSDEPDGDGDGSRPKRERDWDKAWLSYNKGDASPATPSPELRAPDADPKSESRDPRLTKWGGAVRGGKYEMGEGADRLLDAFGSADFLLYAALAVLTLFCILLNFIPPAPR